MTDGMVERVAKGIYEATPYQDQETDIDGMPLGPVYDIPWDKLDEFDAITGRDYFSGLARAAIEAMSQSPNRPERVQAAFEVFKGKPDCGPNAAALFEYIEQLEAALSQAQPTGEKT